MNKINSLTDFIEDCGLSCIVLTETWLKKETRGGIIEELTLSHPYEINSYERPGNNSLV